MLLEQLDLSYFLIFLWSESPSSKHLSTNYSTVPQLIFQSSNVCTVYVWILNTYIQSTAYNDTFILDNLLTVKFWLSIKLWLSNFMCSLLSEAHPSVFTSHDVRFNIASTSPQQLWLWLPAKNNGCLVSMPLYFLPEHQGWLIQTGLSSFQTEH